MTALRALRVLRILRLLRYIDSLRKVLAVLMEALASFAAVGLMIMLFWVLFSIIGLHVYGGLHLNGYFPNYDTFINAMMATFNILNMENLEMDQMRMIEASNWGSALFFVGWVIIGK